MAKRRKASTTPKTDDLGLVEIKPHKMERICVPCGDDREGAHRLSNSVRYGTLSFEVFAKKPERRKELGLPVFAVDN